MNLTKNTGIINFEVTPVDAEIKINTEIHTSKRVELIPGTYEIEISKSGYLPQNEMITIKLGETITKKYELIKNSTVITFNITPSNAKVLINKRDFSNLNTFELAPGNYQIEIEQEGYYPAEDMIEVVLNQPISRSFNLIQKVGELQFKIKPINANVKLKKNGVEIDSWQGLKIFNNLQVGVYAIEAKAEGYKTTRKEVTINENQITIEELRLEEGSDCDKQITYAGKTYNTVQIGYQCWLRENLDIGTMITSNAAGDNQTDNGTIEKYCYDNDPRKCRMYGGLYQWDEAMKYVKEEGTQGICPDGWHIPTKSEMERLETYVNDEAAKLVAVGEPATVHIHQQTKAVSLRCLRAAVTTMVVVSTI